MICPKCGNDMGNSMYCSNCNIYPFKDKEPFQWKSTLKITGIVIGCFMVFFFIVMSVIEIGDKQAYNETMNTKYEEIHKEYSDEEYYSALYHIKDFKDDYGDNKKMMDKISDLSNDIETELYNKIKSADIAISECNTYLEFYPKGKYVKEVNASLAVFSEKQAVQDINKAKEAIQNNDFLEADSLLQSIIDNTKVSENTKKQAQEVLNPIANKVLTEKGRNAILGTWRKETGVTYTFEEDGHMSTNLSSNYNKSAGTASDGIEVSMLLSDIEDWGRCIHGGTWKYSGIEVYNGKVHYIYTLFYNGSMHTCVLEENTNVLGVTLSSGIGNMSVLQK